MKFVQVAEIVMRFVPITSIGIFATLRGTSTPTYWDAIALIGITTVTLVGWWLLDRHVSKKYGDTSYFMDFITRALNAAE